MFFVSSISTKKVDFPSKILSCAPILVNILSTGVNINFSAGTKHPTYAKIIARHAYLNNVDFPPILGPVTSRFEAGSSTVLINVVLGTNYFKFALIFY